MNIVIGLSGSFWNALGCIGELLGYLLRFVSVFFRSRSSPAARFLAAESQLGMCKRRIKQKQHPKPRFSRGFRILWVILSKLWVPWQTVAQLMQPATVKAWHTRAFKLYWRWKSRRKAGRPPISQEMQDLIRKLSRENPLWGAEVIRLTLLNLQYAPPCEDTIRKYMVKPKNPRGKSTTWLPFLRNHMDVSWAIDFFTVNTIRFATLYVFVVLHHGRRKVVHFAITANPLRPPGYEPNNPALRKILSARRLAVSGFRVGPYLNHHVHHGDHVEHESCYILGLVQSRVTV